MRNKTFVRKEARDHMLGSVSHLDYSLNDSEVLSYDVGKATRQIA